MQIPRYWAEHKELRHFPNKKQVTIRRFGWSSNSAAEAQCHAEFRVKEAWDNWTAGKKPSRREHKVAYGGDEGLPIREEIISEHPDIGGVVTRNGYGARCLNVNNMLFADIDLGEKADHPALFLVKGCALALFFAVIISANANNPGLIIVSGLAIWYFTRSILRWRRKRDAANPELALLSVHHWCAKNSSWLVHVYRTPAGFRLLATHAELDPLSSEAEAFFTQVKGDPRYQFMCIKQACFRARVSAKPWRIGISNRIGWGTWPITSVKGAERRSSWIDEYEKQASQYAACEYVTSIGSGTECTRGRMVHHLHDTLCLIGKNLPTA